MKIISKLLILPFVVACVFTACKKDKLAANTKTFNVAKFREAIKSQINFSNPTTPVGYSFVITRGGQIADSFSFGTAYRSATGGAGAWTTSQEINIASVTKAMTAVAVFKLLKQNNLSLGDKIGPWLPQTWFPAQVIKDLTFEELLTHSSGITESSTSYDSIRKVMSQGLVTIPKPKDVYSNVNFAIFRIIIPYLRDKQSMTNHENSMPPENFESLLSNNYLSYMKTNIFSAIGLNNVSLKPSTNTAQAYSEPSGPGQAVGIPGDWTHIAGGGGFYMSVNEMARFMAYLVHSEELLNKEQRALMDSKYAGWDTWNSRMTVAGRAYGKDGALRWDSNNNGIAPDAGDAGLQTLVMKFPNGVELALAINSLPGSWREMSSMAVKAYDVSWE